MSDHNATSAVCMFPQLSGIARRGLSPPANLLFFHADRACHWRRYWMRDEPQLAEVLKPGVSAHEVAADWPKKKQARPVGCSWASTTPSRAAVLVPIAERPVGGRLFAKLKKGDIVIAPKLDRLFRSALDALQVVEDLKKRGVSLHLLDLGGSRPFRL